MLGNFLYQVLYQILILVLPLVTLPYTSRVLGVEGIGTYAYSFAVVSYFVSFANMGVNIYGNREQELPNVKNVKIINIKKDNYDTDTYSDEEAYYVTLKIT